MLVETARATADDGALFGWTPPTSAAHLAPAGTGPATATAATTTAGTGGSAGSSAGGGLARRLRRLFVPSEPSWAAIAAGIAAPNLAQLERAKQLIREGIPIELRPRLWLFLSGGQQVRRRARRLRRPL